MSVSLAPTTFTAGADDKIAAVDVYKTKDTGVVNSIVDVAKKYDGTLTKSFNGMDSLSINGITNNVLNTSSNYIRNTGYSRISGLGDGALLAIRGLNGSMQNNVLSIVSYNSKSGSALNQINRLGNTSIGGITSYIKEANIPVVSDLSNALGNILGNASSITLNDTIAKISLYSNIIKQCSNAGVGGVTQAVIGSIANRQIFTAIAGNVLSNTISGSYTDDLKNMAEYLGSGSLLSTKPDLLNNFTSCYATDENYIGSESNIEFEKIMQTYGAVDENFYSCKRTDGDVLDVSTLSGGTSRFNEIITDGAKQSSDLDTKVSIIATLYKPTSVEQDLSSYYPKSAFVFNQQESSIVTPLVI